MNFIDLCFLVVYYIHALWAFNTIILKLKILIKMKYLNSIKYLFCKTNVLFFKQPNYLWNLSEKQLIQNNYKYYFFTEYNSILYLFYYIKIWFKQHKSK